jgi:hypothetical protein
MSIKYTLYALLFLVSFTTFAHDDYGDILGALHTWKIQQRSIQASFLKSQGDTVYLQDKSGRILHIALQELHGSDSIYASARIRDISLLNALPQKQIQQQPGNLPLYISIVLCIVLLIVLWKLPLPAVARLSLCMAGATALISSIKAPLLLINTDPLQIDSAFIPFKSHLKTRWDNTWFYVESNGLPTTHAMMKGIRGWQQQVPLPQCYIAQNAWSIPLNPQMSNAPIPVNQQHFTRGAIALAVNGVPIFNPYTNTGVDALLDGQLDEWGGHCGRADDYHYHIAPLHLYSVVSSSKPIAYAFDGFAVYGASAEPDGRAIQPLDANHGHYGIDGVYHYHGSEKAPYMIAAMAGKVTEDNTNQLIPQAQAKGVRPALTPLKGAVLTGCVPHPGNNGYIVSYTLNGVNCSVDYTWDNLGNYTFTFNTASGTNTEKYKGQIPCTSIATDVQDKNPNNALHFIQQDNRLFVSDALPIYGAIYKVYAADGRLAATGIWQDNSITISGISRGIYLVLVQSNKAFYTAPFLVP